jgi:transposase
MKAQGFKGRKGYTLEHTAKPDQIIIHSMQHCPACKTSLNATWVQACEKRKVFDIAPVQHAVRWYFARLHPS